MKTLVILGNGFDLDLGCGKLHSRIFMKLKGKSLTNTIDYHTLQQ